MPRLSVLVFWLLLLVVPRAGAQCLDNGADHDRETFKNRAAPTPMPQNLSMTTVSDALAWPVVHVENFDDVHAVMAEEFEVIRLRGSSGSSSVRMMATIIWVAGARTPKAKRVIVEVPLSQTAVRTQLEQLLGGPPPKSGRPFTGAQAVPLEFMGWRFYDVSHQFALVNPKTHKKRTKAQLKVGHGH